SISSEKLSNAICANFLTGDEEASVQAFPDFKSAEDYVQNLNLGPKDVFVTMGAGEAYKVADTIFKLI
ncbi:MAG TPA: hypothetical protein VGO21_00535, partial [Candidatus Paceibacterota bacterium]|nr:hypothetical protein [Candidatus Paceibacterota bacterium]